MVERVRSSSVKPEPKIKLMLDSGAFSAWSKGEQIDIDDYIQYIEDHRQYIVSYVNLDVIPGKPGQERTIEMAEEAAEASYKNFLYMRKHRLDPIPVVHLGEKYKWVQRYLDDGCKYIGLSPSTGLIAKVNSMAWLDGIFTRLTDKEGRPLVKTHGFAVSSFDLMKRYPWHTCDATSWALTAAFGGIYVPVLQGGKPNYSESPVKIAVSDYEDRTKMPKDHITRMGPMVQERVKQFLKDEVGLTLAQVASDYEARAKCVVYVMLKFQDAIGEVRFRHPVRSMIE